MIFFANAQGNITRVIPDSVYQNSHRSSEVVLVAPFSKNVAVGVAFNLPNGMRTSLNFAQPNMGEIDLTDIVDGNGTGYNAWRCLLEQTVTEYAGEVGVQFFVYNGYNVNGNLNLEILATYQSTFNVIKGVSYIPPVVNEDSDVPIYNQIMAYLSMLIANGEGGGNYQPIVSTPPQYTGMLVYLTISPTGQAYIRLPEDIGGGDCDCKPIVSTPPQYSNGIEVPVTIREDNTAYVLIPYSTSGGGGGESGGESTNNGTAGLTYTESNGVATCTGIGEATAKDIVIASEFGDSTVTAIDDSAFANTSITSVTIPATITNIGASAFANCASLIAFIVDTSNENYKAIDGNLYSEDETVLIQYAIGKTDSEFKIPASVTTIGSSAFSGATNLTTLNCTACTSVPTLGSNALSGTSDNLEIIVPYDLYDTWVDEWSAYASKIVKAITNNGTEGLTYTVSNNVATCTGIGTATAKDIVIASTYGNVPVTSIGTGAFAENTDITSVVIPDSVTSIGRSAFSGCSSLTEVVIPASVTEIGASAFARCSSLTEVVIPDSVTGIGASAFSYCSGLTSITVDENNKIYKAIDNNLYSYDETILIQYAIGKTATSFAIPNSVTSIGASAFARCSSLTEVVIPDSVTYISGDAFSYCSGLTSVVIGDSVTTIGEGAFNGATNLAKLDCTACTSVPFLGSAALSGTSDNLEIIVPDDLYADWVSNPYWVALAEEGKIKRKGGGEGTTNGTAGLSYEMSSDGTYALCDGIGTATATDIVIGSLFNGFPVKAVSYYAFKDNNDITSVEIPNSVEIIDLLAFYNCSKLTYVSIGSGVSTLYGSSFTNCPRLSTITISSSNASYKAVNSVIYNKAGNQLVYYASGKTATSFAIPSTVTTIGEEAFAYCRSLTEVKIPNSVTYIGDRAFRDCSGLETLDCRAYTSASSIPTLGSNALWNTSYNLKIIVYDNLYTSWINATNWSAYKNNIVKAITVYGTAGLSYTVSINVAACTGIGTATAKDIVIATKYLGYDVRYIELGAFKDNTDITSVVIPDSVTGIDYEAFRNCSGLTSVVIPDSVTGISDAAFSGCSSLTSVVIPASVTTIGPSAFEDCSSLTSVVIPNSVTEIGDNAFSGCSSLTSVVIGDSVTSIGDDAFSYCSGLTEVVIPDSVTEIGVSAFYSCSGLTSVVIGDSVTTIDNAAFRYCSSLTSVVIPNSVTLIDNAAFAYCNRLEILNCTACTSVPTLGINALLNTSVYLKIIVPDLLYDTWIKEPNWADLAEVDKIIKKTDYEAQ